MVLGNLIGDGAPDFAAMVKHPFRKEDIIYAGIIADHLESWEEEYQKEYQMKFLTPDQLLDDSEALLASARGRRLPACDDPLGIWTCYLRRISAVFSVQSRISRLWSMR